MRRRGRSADLFWQLLPEIRNPKPEYARRLANSCLLVFIRGSQLQLRAEELGQVFHRHGARLQNRLVITAENELVSQLPLDRLAQPVVRHAADKISRKLT